MNAGPDTDSEDARDPSAGGGFIMWDMEAEVVCPHCGEAVTLGLDPGSGRLQSYVEDCQVCCQPWRVQVRYDASGEALVEVEAD